MAFLCSGGEEIISGAELEVHVQYVDPNIVLPEEKDPNRDLLLAAHRGGDCDPTNTYGDSRDTLLHLAAQYGDYEVAQRLMQMSSVVIDARTLAKETPLYAACCYGHDRIATLLLQAGADKNACNIHNETPLFGACYRGHSKPIRALFCQLGVPCRADLRSEDGLLAAEVALARGNIHAFVTLHAHMNWPLVRHLYLGPFKALPIAAVRRIVWYLHLPAK